MPDPKKPEKPEDDGHEGEQIPPGKPDPRPAPEGPVEDGGGTGDPPHNP